MGVGSRAEWGEVMEETNTQRGIRHSKSGTIAAGALVFLAQFFGVENPMERLTEYGEQQDRIEAGVNENKHRGAEIEYKLQALMQGVGITANPLPDGTTLDEVMDAIETMKKMNAQAPKRPTEPRTTRIGLRDTATPPIREALAL